MRKSFLELIMQWKPWIVFRNIISGYRLNATAITKVDLTFKTMAFLQSTKLMSYLSRILLSLRRSNSHLFYVSYWTRTDTGDWYEQIVKGYVITYLLLMLFALVIVFANSLTKINLLSGSPCIKWTDTTLIEVNDISKPSALRIYHNSGFIFSTEQRV